MLYLFLVLICVTRPCNVPWHVTARYKSSFYYYYYYYYLLLVVDVLAIVVVIANNIVHSFFRSVTTLSRCAFCARYYRYDQRA